MNFGRNEARRKLDAIESRNKRLGTKSLLSVFHLSIFGCLLLCVVLTAGTVGIVRGILSNSPNINAMDVSPRGISTTVYDNRGNLVETLVTSGSNRDPVPYSQVPENLVNAFVAIEDSRFWQHQGVDIRGMGRAIVLGVKSRFRSTQGASTITQQLIKNNVFNGGSESTLGAKLVRKIQEQYLATALESRMSKQDIMENYMNTINLGSNCLGVQTAARRYFDKDVSRLTLSECAVIAGITQNPVGYNPINHPQKNAEKRETILNYMVEQGYISEEQKATALADPVYERIQEVNRKHTSVEQKPYSYFVDRLITEVISDLQTKGGYTESQAYTLLYSGGLKIYSTQDPDMQAIVDEEISDPDNYADVDNAYSFTYKLAIQRGNETRTFTDADIKTFINRKTLDYNSQEAIQTVVDSFKSNHLQPTDKILSENINYTLQPQASVVLMDQASGIVTAISGGRGKKTTSLSLNRATSTRRSPGSTFKVLTAFAPAIDACHATLGSVYYDEPYEDPVSGKSFRNWWGSSKYAGYANIRQAITYSMNIVSVKCLVDTVTPRLGYDYALSFGFNTLYDRKDVGGQIYTDINPSLALGGLTDGVTNLQLTAAYAAIANKGTYQKPIFYTKIVDHDGKVLIDNTPDSHRVVTEGTAFLLTDAMQDSTEYHNMNSLFSSTSRAAALDNMPVAGKSGTSTGKTDLWFVGFTPYYTMGIWSGFDDNTAMDANESSSSYHKVIWKKIMTRVNELKGLSGGSFEPPANITKCSICSKSGKLATRTCANDHRGGDGMVYEEYFISGTEPTESCDIHHSFSACTETGLRATEYCPSTYYQGYISIPSGASYDTQDGWYAGSSYEYCYEHTWEKIQEALEESRRAEEESRLAAEESRRAKEESKRAAEESRRAAEASKKAEEAMKNNN